MLGSSISRGAGSLGRWGGRQADIIKGVGGWGNVMQHAPYRNFGSGLVGGALGGLWYEIAQSQGLGSAASGGIGVAGGAIGGAAYGAMFGGPKGAIIGAISGAITSGLYSVFQSLSKSIEDNMPSVFRRFGDTLGIAGPSKALTKFQLALRKSGDYSPENASALYKKYGAPIKSKALRSDYESNPSVVHDKYMEIISPDWDPDNVIKTKEIMGWRHAGKTLLEKDGFSKLVKGMWKGHTLNLEEKRAVQLTYLSGQNPGIVNTTDYYTFFKDADPRYTPNKLGAKHALSAIKSSSRGVVPGLIETDFIHNFGRTVAEKDTGLGTKSSVTSYLNSLGYLGEEKDSLSRAKREQAIKDLTSGSTPSGLSTTSQRIARSQAADITITIQEMIGMKDVTFGNSGELTTEEIKDAVTEANDENADMVISGINEAGGRLNTRGIPVYDDPR